MVVDGSLIFKRGRDEVLDRRREIVKGLHRTLKRNTLREQPLKTSSALRTEERATRFN